MKHERYIWSLGSCVKSEVCGCGWWPAVVRLWWQECQALDSGTHGIQHGQHHGQHHGLHHGVPQHCDHVWSPLACHSCHHGQQPGHDSGLLHCQALAIIRLSACAPCEHWGCHQSSGASYRYIIQTHIHIVYAWCLTTDNSDSGLCLFVSDEGGSIQCYSTPLQHQDYKIQKSWVRKAEETLSMKNCQTRLSVGHSTLLSVIYQSKAPDCNISVTVMDFLSC